MSEKRRERGTVIRNSEISNGIFDMWVRTEEIARLAVPGQFVTLYCEDESRLLPRPISVCDTDETNRALRVVYRIAGKGTKEFSGLSEGAPLTLAGPFGNGFPIREGTSFLIGGGIGIPPMLALAKRLGGEKQMILGFRDKTFLADEFLQYGPVFVATEDGSAGTKGNVLDAIREHHLDAERIYACGPLPMLRAVKAYAAERGMECYVSLEGRMACGIGACLGCVCKSKETDAHTNVQNKRICKEGPVFEAGEVEF